MEKSQSIGMGRRKFIGAAAAALFAGVVISVTGCSEDEPAGPAAGDMVGTVDAFNGHSHSVKITKAEIDAAGDITLTLTATGGHTHDLKLTAAQVATLKSGGELHGLKSEIGSGHQHSVHFMG